MEVSDIDFAPKERLERFGHHPDAAIDFCIEVECLQGLAFDVRHGLMPMNDLPQRLGRAMNFRVGGDLQAIGAKQALREIEDGLRRNFPTLTPE